MTPWTTMLEKMLLRELTSLRRELEAYPDEATIWSLPAGLPNSAGTLTLHLAGNLQHYIGAVLGSTGYVRNRPLEFSARGVPRATLLAEIDATEAAVRGTLPRIDEAALAESFPEPVGGSTLQTGEFLGHVAVHLGYHLGQIDYHRRVVTGDATGVGALAPGALSTSRPTVSG